MCETIMKLKVAFDPDIVALMQAEIAAGEKAVSAAMRNAGTSLESAWRGQITGAGLGKARKMAASRPVNGNAAQACACGSSIAVAGRACWSLKGG